MAYLFEIGLGLTRLGNALLGGHADESMSSRAWRAEGNDKPWGRITRPFIDWLWRLFGQHDHCSNAYWYERHKAPLPVITQ